jgi:hypothetical protein
MNRALMFFVVLLWIPSLSCADSFHKLVGVECQPENSVLIVRYRGAYNEAGESMIKNKGSNEWDPWALVRIEDDGKRTVIVSIREVEKNCRLGDATYSVAIRPVPGNYNVQGRCGAHMSAGVRIKKGSEEIINTDFEGDCHEDGPVITAIKIRPETKAEFTEVKSNEFYK